MIKRVELTNPWEGYVEPFKMADNLYFVGTVPASSHLIDTGEGLILIDTGYMAGLYIIIDSIYKLGFKPEDIKYIINSHWHWDHAEASGALAKLTGAKNIIGKEDAEDVKRYLTPDIAVKEGDSLVLGNTKIDFKETPGHTKGTLSIFFDVTYNGKPYRAGMFGGAGCNTLRRENHEYEGCVSDYLHSLNRLRKESVDFFLGNHASNNNTVGKGELILKTGENKFIDTHKEWLAFLDKCEKNLNNILETEKSI